MKNLGSTFPEGVTLSYKAHECVPRLLADLARDGFDETFGVPSSKARDLHLHPEVQSAMDEANEKIRALLEVAYRKNREHLVSVDLVLLEEKARDLAGRLRQALESPEWIADAHGAAYRITREMSVPMGRIPDLECYYKQITAPVKWPLYCDAGEDYANDRCYPFETIDPIEVPREDGGKCVVYLSYNNFRQVCAIICQVAHESS